MAAVMQPQVPLMPQAPVAATSGDSPQLISRSNKALGHYLLGRTLGEGTFGKVKLARHLLTGERVAVKILEKAKIVEVADVERVAREVQILKTIRHPHVVQLYEIIETPGQLYLVMEYAGGGELFDLIVRRGRLSERQACTIFHQIIAGVERVHALNIVHRDLKPENLLLDEVGYIKIADFGLGNIFHDGQLLKTACGSPCYAPPEMVAGHRYVPQMCDLWSCGVILFAMVAGYLPFEDPNTAALYRKIMAADYSPPNYISSAVRELIAGLLTVDPRQRFTIEQVRAHRWYCQMPEASLPAPPQNEQPRYDEEVMEQVRLQGFPRDYVIQCLQQNKHNNVTTSYYLLLEAKKRGRPQSASSQPGPPSAAAASSNASTIRAPQRPQQVSGQMVQAVAYPPVQLQQPVQAHQRPAAVAVTPTMTPRSTGPVPAGERPATFQPAARQTTPPVQRIFEQRRPVTPPLPTTRDGRPPLGASVIDYGRQVVGQRVAMPVSRTSSGNSSGRQQVVPSVHTQSRQTARSGSGAGSTGSAEAPTGSQTARVNPKAGPRQPSNPRTARTAQQAVTVRSGNSASSQPGAARPGSRTTLRRPQPHVVVVASQLQGRTQISAARPATAQPIQSPRAQPNQPSPLPQPQAPMPSQGRIQVAPSQPAPQQLPVSTQAPVQATQPMPAQLQQLLASPRTTEKSLAAQVAEEVVRRMQSQGSQGGSAHNQMPTATSAAVHAVPAPQLQVQVSTVPSQSSTPRLQHSPLQSADRIQQSVQPVMSNVIRQPVAAPAVPPLNLGQITGPGPQSSPKTTPQQTPRAAVMYQTATMGVHNPLLLASPRPATATVWQQPPAGARLSATQPGMGACQSAAVPQGATHRSTLSATAPATPRQPQPQTVQTVQRSPQPSAYPTWSQPMSQPTAWVGMVRPTPGLTIRPGPTVAAPWPGSVRLA